MLTVMDKYDDLRKLEELHLKNLGMGSLLILLPFCPEIKKLTLKYPLRLSGLWVSILYNICLDRMTALQTSVIPCSGEFLRKTNSVVWRWLRSGARASVSSLRSGWWGTATSWSSSSHCRPGTPTRRSRWRCGGKGGGESRTQSRLTSRAREDDICTYQELLFISNKWIF